MSDKTEVYTTEDYLNRELLRFTTAGSVDDGKSTLIGRLLYDSKVIFQDQVESLKRTSELRGEKEINLALLTDGLRAEREQGITIDVAYRYFSTPKRKFIIADTPGHEQYTRNMVTGASTADLAIFIIDARNGVVTQSKRHGFIASLLGIPHLIVAINKMDLVDYSKEVFDRIVQEYRDFSEKLEIKDIIFVPVSALVGDNVVHKSERMDWYQGGTILYYLENITIAADRNLIDFRFPVQYVIRPHQDFRGFAGRVASGTIRKGEEILVLPARTGSKVKEIHTAEGELEEAYEKQSVVITLEDEVDVSRGDMIVRKHNVPFMGSRFEAVLCWMDDSKPLSTVSHYIIQHTTLQTQAYISSLRYRIDVNTLHREEATALSLNEIGRVEIETAAPIFYDPYERNRNTGSFILIDPSTNLTVGAGIIRGETRDLASLTAETVKKSSNVVWEKRLITREEREKRNKHRGHTLWFTGLSGAGKSTLARQIEDILFRAGKQVYLLDGDNVRHGLNGDLGFSPEERKENIRRIGHVARLFYDAGHIVICSFISPNIEMRNYVRNLLPPQGFSEVFVRCDIEICKARDPKGLYAKAIRGEIPEFTGISAPYEAPVNPELEIDTGALSLENCVETIISYIQRATDI